MIGPHGSHLLQAVRKDGQMCTYERKVLIIMMRHSWSMSKPRGNRGLGVMKGIDRRVLRPSEALITYTSKSKSLIIGFHISNQRDRYLT
jgi:hypothetical protein